MCVHAYVCTYIHMAVRFLVNASLPKPLDVATFDVEGTEHHSV